MLQTRYSFNFSESKALIDYLKSSGKEFSIESGTINHSLFQLKLPFCFKQITLVENLYAAAEKAQSALFLLVQSGSAALGYSNNGELIHHKVIKKYMIRKKQGKAQLKHLNAKGKSRLGSRIRLQQADKFFNEIHEKIGEWGVLADTQQIYFSYAKTLIPFIYETPDRPILKKDDPRLFKLPFDLEEPNFKTLQFMNKTVHKSILIIENEMGKDFFNPFLQQLNK